MGLKCLVPKCKGVINGMTGLQELDKLRSHYLKAHKSHISMEEAMVIRERIETTYDVNS